LRFPVIFCPLWHEVAAERKKQRDNVPRPFIDNSCKNDGNILPLYLHAIVTHGTLARQADHAAVIITRCT